jgi:hypothetical protein
MLVGAIATTGTIIAGMIFVSAADPISLPEPA